MYITQCLHRMVQRAPDAIATIDGDRQHSWSELQGRVARYAGALRTLGVAAGDRVAVLSRNGDHFLDYILGTLWAGGVINPVNLRWTAAEMGYSLADCDTRVLIVEPEFEPLMPDIRAAAPGLAHVLSTGDAASSFAVPQSAWLAGATPMADALRRGNDLAAILYTGGTTGRPKGVMLSHGNLIASALGSLAEPGCAPGRVFLHSAPLFHIGALSGLLCGLIAGSTAAFIPAFEPVAMIEAVAAHRVTACSSCRRCCA